MSEYRIEACKRGEDNCIYYAAEVKTRFLWWTYWRAIDSWRSKRDDCLKAIELHKQPIPEPEYIS